MLQAMRQHFIEAHKKDKKSKVHVTTMDNLIAGQIGAQMYCGLPNQTT